MQPMKRRLVGAGTEQPQKQQAKGLLLPSRVGDKLGENAVLASSAVAAAAILYYITVYLLAMVAE